MTRFTLALADRPPVTGDLQLVTPPVTGIPLPAGEFARILHDDEALDDRQRVGFPEVFPLHLSKYCDLTQAWRDAWFAQLVHSYTGYAHFDKMRLTRAERDMLEGKFQSLGKSSEAFTNFRGLETDDPGQEPLICCGNVVRVTGPSVRLAGEWKTPIETLDGNRPPPPLDKVNRQKTPWLVFCATNVAAQKIDGVRVPIVLPDGRYRVDPFPQLGSRDTLVYLRTNGREATTYNRDGVWYAVNYIRSSRLRAVTGVVPTPYVLP